MLNRVKYLFVPVDGHPVYESYVDYDSVVEHRSFSDLTAAVSRPFKRVVAIEQRGVGISHETYHMLKPDTRVTVVCKAAVG